MSEITFRQLFSEDRLMANMLGILAESTNNWMRGSIHNENSLLLNLSNTLAKLSLGLCKSSAFPSISMSSSRTILDRKGDNGTDLFGSDLGITLSMLEGGVLVKQRTALIQLKIGKNVGSCSEFLLDVRQIFDGQSRLAAGKWYLAICEKPSALWRLAGTQILRESLDETALGKVPYSNPEERSHTLMADDSWYSITAWILDWISKSIGNNSDIDDPKRIEMVLEQVRMNEEQLKAGFSLEKFVRRLEAEDLGGGPIRIPRQYIEFKVDVKPPAE